MNTMTFKSRYGIDYHRRTDGKWIVTACGFPKSTHPTEADAIEQAERLEVQEEAWHTRR